MLVLKMDYKHLSIAQFFEKATQDGVGANQRPKIAIKNFYNEAVLVLKSTFVMP